MDQHFDVVVLGGGLAGLTLGIQLRRARPAISVAILEKREGPAPLAAFKVGESTVETSAHYFAEVIGMRDHMESDQLPKAGLRFFFPADDNRDFARRLEWGNPFIPPFHTFQLDRGLFENELAKRNRAAGNALIAGARVQDLELGLDTHRVSFTQGGEAMSVQARWLVDAAGRASIVKRKLGLAKDTEHTINSAWLRLGGGLDIEEWSSQEAWLARMPERGIRRLSTNHLMGQGYWVWLIPLSSGAISIGVVADPRFHSFDQINTLDGIVSWLLEHEPPLGEAIDSRREEVQDFLKVENFAYDCKRVYSPARWCLTGEAGVFADPFYSPGSDSIAISNSLITDMITRDLEGEDVAERVERSNTTFLNWFETAMFIYTDQYPLWGSPEVMSAKLAWDFAAYWAANALLFVHGRWHDLDLRAAVAEDYDRVSRLIRRMQGLFREWGAHDPGDWRDQFVVPTACDSIRGLYLALLQPMDEEALKAQLAANVGVLAAAAVVIFHQAAAQAGLQLESQARIDPEAVTLDQSRWASDGLFSDAGLTLEEARAMAPGLEQLFPAPVAT